MAMTSVGDLAHTFQMRNHNTRLKLEVVRLSQELASGKIADLSSHLSGEFTEVASIEHALRTLDAQNVAARETSLLLETAQIALGTVQDVSANLAPALISAGNSNHPSLLRTTSTDAAQKFDTLVAALNTRIADRSVFSGMDTDRAALMTGPEILMQLRSDLAGESTVSGVMNAIEVWFTQPGGPFETFAYSGAATDLAPIPISETERVDFNVRADNAGLRQTMKAFALGAIATDLPLLTDTSDRATLLRNAGETMLTGQTDLAILRSDIGALESYSDAARTRNSAARSTFEISRTELYTADPFQIASELETAQTQLEAVYALTARISRMSLADYLR